MSLSIPVANDIAEHVLSYYVRGGPLSQTTQDKPLMRILKANQKTFPGGKDVVSLPVKGAYISDTAASFKGYSEDDILTFSRGENLKRVEYPWREMHMGLNITWTELKKDGIHVTDSNRTSESSDVELIRLTGILKDRMSDYMESYARLFNDMLWQDGSQDAKAVPGVLSLLLDAPAVGTTGGLSRVTYPWWRNRAILGTTPSPSLQTLTQVLRTEKIQLSRFQGKPNHALCGSEYLSALRLEVSEKGYYTQNNFSGKGGTNISMANVTLDNLTFEYDPTLDNLGLSKYCYIFDDRRLVLYVMEGEDDKILNPERPYDQAVFLKSMTWTGALTMNQLNANGVYSVA